MDLTCDTVMVAAADEVDVCALFEDEVDPGARSRLGRRRAFTSTRMASDSPSGTCGRLSTPDVAATANVPSDALNSSGKPSPRADRGSSVPSGTTLTATESRGTISIDDTASTSVPAALAWAKSMQTVTKPATSITRDGLVLALLDDDGDPLYGDIGKVDRQKKEPGATAVKNSAPGADGKADNYADGNEACSDDDGGDGCDAKMLIPLDYTFKSGTAFECEADRTVTVECTWDAQGQLSIATGIPAECLATDS